MYILIRDDNSHWYVIPADKEDEWFQYLDDVEAMVATELDEPEWAVQVGGAPTLVKFPSFTIGE